MSLARKLRRRRPVRGELTQREAEVLVLTRELLREFGTGSRDDEVAQQAIEHAFGEPLAGTLGILDSYGLLRRGSAVNYFRLSERGEAEAERQVRARAPR